MKSSTFSARIYYEDTDAGGVAYHTTYLRYMERGRTEWLRDRGWTLEDVRAIGVVLVVRRLEIDFLAPAGLDDKVSVLTEYDSHTRTRVYFAQSIHMGEVGSARQLCRAKVCCACRDSQAPRPRAIPGPLLRAFG